MKFCAGICLSCYFARQPISAVLVAYCRMTAVFYGKELQDRLITVSTFL
jgi:hypothetical protein